MLLAILVFTSIIFMAMFGLEAFLVVGGLVIAANYFGVFPVILFVLSLVAVYALILTIDFIKEKAKDNKPNIIKEQQAKAILRRAAK